MSSHSLDPIQILRHEFRGHLEQFYTQLTLAPPYHSIEKAVQYLSNSLRTKPEGFSERLLLNTTYKWNFFQEIFLAAGLQRKHRGIILQLVRSSSYSVTSSESLRFLEHFTNAVNPEDKSAKTAIHH